MNLNFLTPINDLSYGLAGFNILKALSMLDVNIALFPIGQTTGQYQEEDLHLLQKCVSNQSFFDNTAPSLRLFHQFSLAEHVGKGVKIGFPIFELDQFNDREIHHLRAQDELIVCSNWAKEILRKYNFGQYGNVHVVPLGVDRSIFYDYSSKNGLQVPPNSGINTVFLNVAKIEVRKGHDILVEAFNKAFTPKDNVRLWLAWHNFFIKEDQVKEWTSLYKNSPLGDKIHIFDRLPSQVDIAGIMRSSDCGVFPSRAEGWNLGLLEMMSCGKPVICTDYSGHTEYVNHENSMLIDIKDTEPAYDGVFFFGQGNWASFDESHLDQLIEHMRHIHREKQSGQLKKNLKGIETAERFSWENSARRVLEVIK